MDKDNYEDQFSDLPPRSDDELKKLENESIQYLKQYGVDNPIFTCSTCNDKRTCYFAFDGYNIDGDCLALK